MLKLVINIVLFLALLAFGQLSVAQTDSPRIKQSLNEDWQFTLDEPEDGNWKRVDIPHTWNDEDAFDEEPGYLRTVAWYKKTLSLKPVPGKKYVLFFEAVNQVAEVFVNGNKAGAHKGGYTAFTVDITSYLNGGKNEILVKADNRHNEDIPPLKGDFNFYGGIYRDVWLYELNPIHFDFGEYASTGIFVTTPQVSADSASVQIEGNISIENGGGKGISIVNRLLDPRNNVVAEKEQHLDVLDSSVSFIETFDSIESPRLWHPGHPYLYTLISEIRKEDEVLDRVATGVGFRWFHFDADSGFYLNGSRLKLMGVNRHQDYKGKGNALSNARHVADVELAKKSGSNFLRTAHYPQDPAVLEACDRLGLLVSMEIPIDHKITDSPEFYENSIRMQREMIRQNFNHPGIIIWAYMNEMLLGRNWERDRDHIQKITDFAHKLEEVTREEDPSRYTMIPNHGDFDLYYKAGLTEIPMLVGWNLYFGWYESELEGLGKFLDRYHKKLPEKPVIITEYGAGSDPRIRAPEPVRFDFSMEWQTRFLQSNLKQITERPFVAGAAVWNLFDFGSESRRDAVPNTNSKGLMTFNRKPKDSYYLLQSWLKEEPVIRIGSKSWDNRAGKVISADAEKFIQPVEIYGNTGRAELFINGESLGTKNFTDHVMEWDVAFRDGRNMLEVQSNVDGKVIKDVATIDFSLHRAFPEEEDQEFEDIYINAGSNFYFVDETNGIVWHPDEAYEKGFWGYVGGENYRPRDRGIGIADDILGTNRDPLFQTQRIGTYKYQFDVPSGTYGIVFLFADLDGNKASAKEQSVFDVYVNEQQVFDGLRLRKSYGKNRAVEKKTVVNGDQDQLLIEFKPLQGKAVLNGIGIRKIR